MKKLILGILLVFPFILKAQTPYKFGIGAGYQPFNKEFTINSKLYLKSGDALELILSSDKRFNKATLLFDANLPITSKNLKIVAGVGTHVGVWKDGFRTNSYTTNPVIGMDGILGLEYRIPKLPVSIQAHYQPSVDFIGNTEFFPYKEQLGIVFKIIL